jgi:hypothetical protein
MCNGEVKVLSYTIKLLTLKSLYIYMYINENRGFGYVIRCETDGIVYISCRKDEVGNIESKGVSC